MTIFNVWKVTLESLDFAVLLLASKVVWVFPAHKFTTGSVYVSSSMSFPFTAVSCSLQKRSDKPTVQNLPSTKQQTKQS